MQSTYASEFNREMGCTEREWLMWLPAAMGEVPWQIGAQSLQADFLQTTNAHLVINWRVGEPRRIAMITLPRMHMHFLFTGLDDNQRYAFMKRFDLFMHRGGG